jgi:hypothetical protein
MRPRGTTGTLLFSSLQAIALALSLSSCSSPGSDIPAVAFWNELRTLCGRSFFGTPIQVSPLDSAVVGQTLILNVWQCWNEEVRIAFHVGNDHSRVWVLAWDQERLTLHHSVHTAGGQPADFTNYGGQATEDGTAFRQTFVPDQETLVRFQTARGSSWTLELVPNERLTYAFDPGLATQRFRIDFDLRSPAPRPPSPWGWTRSSRPGPAPSR